MTRSKSARSLSRNRANELAMPGVVEHHVEPAEVLDREVDERPGPRRRRRRRCAGTRPRRRASPRPPHPARRSTSAMTTCAPSATNSSAVARPIPLGAARDDRHLAGELVAHAHRTPHRSIHGRTQGRLRGASNDRVDLRTVGGVERPARARRRRRRPRPRSGSRRATCSRPSVDGRPAQRELRERPALAAPPVCCRSSATATFARDRARVRRDARTGAPSRPTCRSWNASRRPGTRWSGASVPLSSP